MSIKELTIDPVAPGWIISNGPGSFDDPVNPWGIEFGGVIIIEGDIPIIDTEPGFGPVWPGIEFGEGVGVGGIEFGGSSSGGGRSGWGIGGGIEFSGSRFGIWPSGGGIEGDDGLIEFGGSSSGGGRGGLPWWGPVIPPQQDTFIP